MAGEETVQVAKLVDGVLPDKYMPEGVKAVATALNNAKTIDDALMSGIIADGTSATAAQLSATNAEMLPPMVASVLADDPTIRQAAIDAVDGALDSMPVVAAENTGAVTNATWAGETTSNYFPASFPSTFTGGAPKQMPVQTATWPRLIDGKVSLDVLPELPVMPGSGALTMTALPTKLGNNRRQNAVSFTQDPIKTLPDGTQYAVWMDDARNPIIGRRVIPSPTWDVFPLASIPGNPLAAPTTDDGHNSYSLGIDHDGYLHIAGNQHSDTMHYIRSSKPWDHTSWVGLNAMTGIEEGNVGYPQFVNLPGGELLFLYRAGASGMGRTYLNAYDTASKSWSRRAYLFDGRSVAPTESAYTNKIAVSEDGTLFIFWMWRQGPDPSTHHDLSCIKSVDGGATWKTVSGTAISVPIQPTNTAARITATSGVNGALNQSGATVDSSGRPWAVFTQDLSADNHGFGTSAVRWDGTAWVWTRAGATGVGVPLWYYVSRPAVFAWRDRVFVLYVREYKDDGHTLHLSEVTPGKPVQDIVLFRGRLGMYEPVFDGAAINQRDELHMIVTPTAEDEAANVPDLVSTWGAVLSVDLTRVDELFGARLPRGEQKFIGAQQMVSVFGTPVQGITDGRASWTLPSSGLAVVGGWVEVPPEWTSFRLEVLWTPPTADAGDVVFNGRTSSLRATNQLSSQERNWGDVVAGSPAIAKSIALTVLAPQVYASIFPGGLFVSARRQGDASGDTYPQGAIVLGLILTRLS